MSEIKNHSKAYWTCQILGWGIYGLLNTVFLIRALVIENPERARDMISKLSELFRYALQVSSTRSVLLKEELAIVKNYLQLEAIQLEDRLRYEFDIAPETRQVEIPPMTVQTLVENAIRHGIAQHPDGGEISIQTTLQQTVMVVCIVNTGQLKNNTTNDGIGLQNTRERLRLLFGNTAQLTVENISQNQVCARFQVPLTGQQI